jgi:MFS family permease
MRLATFVMAAALGAMGGALLAPVSGLADPTMAHWTTSGFLVFMVVLGGYRRLLGPLVGALVFVFLQDRLQAATSSWRGVFGVVLIVLVVAAPDGLAGLAGRARRLTRRVPASPAVVEGTAVSFETMAADTVAADTGAVEKGAVETAAVETVAGVTE